MINGTVFNKSVLKREIRVTGREMDEIIVPFIEKRLRDLLKQRPPENLSEAITIFKVWWRGTHPRVGRPSYPKPIDWDTIEKHINWREPT